MGRTILHDTMGFLADFDPFGKQEFTWTSFRFYLDCIAFEQRAETLRHVAAAVALIAVVGVPSSVMSGK